MPELSEEMNAQVLNDILGDNAKITNLVQRIQRGDPLRREGVKIEWRDLEELDYVASQLVKKIKYLRGDRY